MAEITIKRPGKPIEAQVEIAFPFYRKKVDFGDHSYGALTTWTCVTADGRLIEIEEDALYGTPSLQVSVYRDYEIDAELYDAPQCEPIEFNTMMDTVLGNLGGRG